MLMSFAILCLCYEIYWIHALDLYIFLGIMLEIYWIYLANIYNNYEISCLRNDV